MNTRLDEQVLDYGLQTPELAPDHWVRGSGKATARFGASTDLNPSGDWSKYDPRKELQYRNGFESMNCTNYGTGFALLALAKFLGFRDFVQDSSERYTGVMTGTSPTGNDPHKVIEVIRTSCGLIEDANLPWKDEDTWDEYYSPNPMDAERRRLGESLLRKFEIGHEWVIPPGSTMTPVQKKAKLQEALRLGTVAVSVRAWKKDGSVYVKDVGEQDTHWVWLMRYDNNGYPIIRDQYDPYDKKLAKEYDFGFSKVYFLKRNESGISPEQSDYLSRVIAWATDAIKRLTDALFATNKPVPVIPPPPVSPDPEVVPSVPAPAPAPAPKPVKTNREKLYDTSKSLLGTRQVSPSVPQELGCASSLNSVFRKCFGKEIGGGASTAQMFAVLKADTVRFMEVSEKDALPGDIMMNATGTSTKGAEHGHVGIRGVNDAMSNDSDTGLWSAQWTNAGWKAYFEVQLGFKTRYFRVRG